MPTGSGARAEGLPDEDLAALGRSGLRSARRTEMGGLRLGAVYVRSDLGEVPAAVDANLRRHFDAQERSDIELAARTMYWLNQTSNSVDALLARTRGHAVRRSTRSRSSWRSCSTPSSCRAVPLAQPQAAAEPALDGPCDPAVLRKFEERGPDISGPGVGYVRPGDRRSHPGEMGEQGLRAGVAVRCFEHGPAELTASPSRESWATTWSAFPGMKLTRKHGTTDLTGEIQDQAEMLSAAAR